MKLAKKFFMGALIAAPLLFVAHTSKAGIFSDFLHWLDGRDRDKKDHPSTTKGTGNSVPVNGGLVFLVVAGLGLGAKMIFDHNKGNRLADKNITII